MFWLSSLSTWIYHFTQQNPFSFLWSYQRLGSVYRLWILVWEIMFLFLLFLSQFSSCFKWRNVSIHCFIAWPLSSSSSLYFCFLGKHTRHPDGWTIMPTTCRQQNQKQRGLFCDQRIKNRYLQRYMCLLRYFDRNYMMHTRASLMYNEMDVFWARTEYHFEYCIWQQMLTEMFAFWFITQSLLKTKQMAKSTLKVKINSKSWEAIKMIGPWTYLHKYKM